MATSDTILSKTRLNGGPLMITGVTTVENGDTTASIDLSSYLEPLQGIESIIGIKGYTAAGARHAVTSLDYTTDPQKLAITFADPTGDASFHWTIVGR